SVNPSSVTVSFGRSSTENNTSSSTSVTSSSTENNTSSSTSVTSSSTENNTSSSTSVTNVVDPVVPTDKKHPKGNNGVGTGYDPQPPGNPNPNDTCPGMVPGHPCHGFDTPPNGPAPSSGAAGGSGGSGGGGGGASKKGTSSLSQTAIDTSDRY